MSRDLREALRAAINRKTRRLIVWTAEPRSAGCGVEQMEYVLDCRTCAERKRGRERFGRSPQLVLDLST